jgi:hypothetical protein
VANPRNPTGALLNGAIGAAMAAAGYVAFAQLSGILGPLLDGSKELATQLTSAALTGAALGAVSAAISGSNPGLGAAYGAATAAVLVAAAYGGSKAIAWIKGASAGAGAGGDPSESRPLTMKEDISRTADVQSAIEAVARKLGRFLDAAALKVERWAFSGSLKDQPGAIYEGGQTIKVNDAFWDQWRVAQRIHVIAHELAHYADSLRPGFWGDHAYWYSRAGYLNNPYEILAEHRASVVSGLPANERYGSLVGAFGF